jgi:hypothetical protein
MAAAEQLSQKEVNQRTAVLRRFKELLKAQRDRFRAYLEALDRSGEVIEQGTAEDLLRHVELEEKIVADIYSIQKVIDPLEDMYRAARTEPAYSPGGDGVSGLKSALEDLRTETAARAERNRELLSKRMTELRNEIKSLRSNPYTRRQPGFSSAGTAGRVDIQG